MIKSKQPQVKFVTDILEYDELRILANTHLMIELISLDKSFINYTLDDTFPTAQMGILVRINLIYNDFIVI